MTLTLLHTAKVHMATFDKLRDRIASDEVLHHIVRKDLLDRAQDGINPELEREITSIIQSADGPVLCTCTTIGAVAEAAGALRVDWPMMQAAAATGGPILMAYAVQSTWEPSLTLLERALADAGTPTKVHPLPLLPYWPLFQAGEHDAFHAVIAGEIRQAIHILGKKGCVVLAQASMAGAAERLQDLPVPVLSAPELALRTVLAHR